MTRSEHQRVVAEQTRLLRPYERELDRLVVEAQAWVDRLKVVKEKTEAGDRRNAKRTS